MNVVIPSNLSCLPLRKIAEMGVNCSVEIAPEREVARRLREREIPIAFVSPYEYAKESSEYRILPGVAVSSSSAVALHFREHLHDIRTIAVDPNQVSEIVLARIVLAEQFEIKPAIVPLMNASLEQMLAKADAGLLAEDAFVQGHYSHACNIDLAELWTEMTDLPYVHGFFCTREEIMPKADMSFLAGIGARIREEGVGLTGGEAPDDPGSQSIIDFLRSFSYEMTGDVEDGIIEFLSYAHAYGMIPDIPELRFTSESAPT